MQQSLILEVNDILLLCMIGNLECVAQAILRSQLEVLIPLADQRPDVSAYFIQIGGDGRRLGIGKCRRYGCQNLLNDGVRASGLHWGRLNDLRYLARTIRLELHV